MDKLANIYDDADEVGSAMSMNSSEINLESESEGKFQGNFSSGGYKHRSSVENKQNDKETSISKYDHYRSSSPKSEIKCQEIIQQLSASTGLHSNKCKKQRRNSMLLIIICISAIRKIKAGIE